MPASDATKRVWMALASRAGDPSDPDPVEASVAEIQAWAQIGPTGVARGRETLRAAGLIAVERRTSEAGVPAANIYHLAACIPANLQDKAGDP